MKARRPLYAENSVIYRLQLDRAAGQKLAGIASHNQSGITAEAFVVGDVLQDASGALIIKVKNISAQNRSSI